MDRKKIIESLSNNQQVLRSYGVKSIYLFGSHAREDATPGSDVDLLVEFESTARVGLFEFARLKQKLSELLGCDVDLATPGALHKAMKDQILKEAVRAA